MIGGEHSSNPFAYIFPAKCPNQKWQAGELCALSRSTRRTRLRALGRIVEGGDSLGSFLVGVRFVVCKVRWLRLLNSGVTGVTAGGPPSFSCMGLNEPRLAPADAAWPEYLKNGVGVRNLYKGGPVASALTPGKGLGPHQQVTACCRSAHTAVEHALHRSEALRTKEKIRPPSHHARTPLAAPCALRGAPPTRCEGIWVSKFT